MKVACYRKGERDKEWDWREVVYTTDRFSEVLFELAKACNDLDSCSDCLSSVDEVFNCGSSLGRIEKAEEELNRKAEEWADDPIFQAEIKIRLEVLRLQKGYIKERLEQIRNKLPIIQRLLDVVVGEKEE